MKRHASSRRAGLLVLPGWDDDGKSQFDALERQLGQDDWVCRRASIPDVSWPASERATVSRDDSMNRVLEDYMDLAAVRGVSRSRMALLGFSYGGYMASLLAAAKPVALLVLRSPALYLDTEWTAPKEQLDVPELDAYRQTVHAPVKNRALASCATFRGDVLLIDSELDEIIPRPVIQSYERAFVHTRSLVRHTLKGADHQLSEASWRREYHALVVDWLGAHIDRD